MDGPGGYYENEITRKRKQIPYDFIYMQNLKNKKVTHIYKQQMNGCRGEALVQIKTNM